MPPSDPNLDPTVSALLRELEALRGRLNHAQAWFSRPQDTMKAGALAEQVKRCCQEACRSDDEEEVAVLLTEARGRLDELQALLGLH